MELVSAADLQRLDAMFPAPTSTLATLIKRIGEWHRIGNNEHSHGPLESQMVALQDEAWAWGHYAQTVISTRHPDDGFFARVIR